MPRYRLDLFTLEAREFHVTDGKAGGKPANFKGLKKNGIAIGGRAYGNVPGIAYLRHRKAGYALRIRSHGFAIYDGKNRKTGLLQRFSRQGEGKTGEIIGKRIINGRYGQVRVCTLRKNKGSERAGLKRLKKENRRKQGGKAVTPLQRESNKYVMVAASLGKEEAAAAQAPELYRMRRQIETAFKRLKPLFRYSGLPAENKERVDAYGVTISVNNL